MDIDFNFSFGSGCNCRSREVLMYFPYYMTLVQANPSVQSLEVESSGKHDGRSSRDPLPIFFCAGGHCGQFWHWQGCPLFDVVVDYSESIRIQSHWETDTVMLHWNAIIFQQACMVVYVLSRSHGAEADTEISYDNGFENKLAIWCQECKLISYSSRLFIPLLLMHSDMTLCGLCSFCAGRGESGLLFLSTPSLRHV